MTTTSPPGRRHGDRLTPENAALVLLDHQTGIMLGVADFGPTEFKNNVLALAGLAHIHGLPTVQTTSFETGPNGPLMVPTNRVAAAGERQGDWRKATGEKLGGPFGGRLTFHGDVQSNIAVRAGGGRG